MDSVCRICNNSRNNERYRVREMMFGTRDEFEYFQCSRCGSLQIQNVPDDLGKYYPENYYSFSKPAPDEVGYLKRFVKRQRTDYYLGGENIAGLLLTKIFGPPELPEWVTLAGLEIDARILDFGCGAGQLLFYLYNEGFSDLTGFDPFIGKEVFYENGIRIFKEGPGKSHETFEFILLNHSFEHVADPAATLKAVSEKTRPGGLVVIRTPVVASYAWEKYAEHWVQLDAPRHVLLQSPESMALLSKQAGLRIEMVHYDSNELQFWGSEQYLRDIPLQDERSYANGLKDSIFTEKDIERFRQEAERLNAGQKGDQACFCLRKI